MLSRLLFVTAEDNQEDLCSDFLSKAQIKQMEKYKCEFSKEK